ncbi:hypothetical protein FB567DRAFT_585399, partial [Paraphoma chrysanthemicola]
MRLLNPPSSCFIEQCGYCCLSHDAPPKQVHDAHINLPLQHRNSSSSQSAPKLRCSTIGHLYTQHTSALQSAFEIVLRSSATMARILTFLLALLASVRVEAKSKADQIRAYQFDTDYCVGNPKGSNIDLPRDKCVNIAGGRSVKPVVDTKRVKWLNDVNNGAHTCYLMSFSDPDCPDTKEADRVGVLELPAGFDKCITKTLPVRSAKFVCGLKFVVNESVHTSTYTTTMVATSWSLGNNDLLTPHELTKTVTQTTTSAISSTVPGAPVASTSTSRRLEARADTKNEPMTLDVWMYQPWSRTAICYHCYRKKESDFGNFKCKGGPNVKATCPLRPEPKAGEPITSVTTILHVSTQSTSTTVVSTMTDGTLVHTSTQTVTAPALERRSWHKSVFFQNPWVPGHYVCADAEWEKRGKAETEIRLQKIKYKNDKDCRDAQSIDLPPPIVQPLHISSTKSSTTTTSTVTGWTKHTTTTTTVTAGRPSGAAMGDVSDDEDEEPKEAELPNADASDAVPLHGDL